MRIVTHRVVRVRGNDIIQQNCLVNYFSYHERRTVQYRNMVL